MMDTTYYLAIVECHNDKFDLASAQNLSKVMDDLKAATNNRGSTEIYQVTDNQALLRFRAEVRKATICKR
jgi:hypothetical protein